MTYVEFAGYTRGEKEQIARRGLLPAQIAAYGLSGRLRLSKRALRDLIEGWTYEPGVGLLDAQLNALVRSAALTLVAGQTTGQKPGQKAGQKTRLFIDGPDLVPILGPRPMDIHGVSRTNQVGVVNGLVMNSVEGAVTAVEASTYPGHEEFIITGSVGPVMRESCLVALSVVRQGRQGDPWALPPALFGGQTLHLHFPAGSVDKEGPSAGVGIAVAIFSRYTGIPVRRKVAMTGELSLEGQVMRIGGLKKKILGAHRAGARLVIIPAANAPDLVDIPPVVRAELEIVLATKFEEVLEHALVKPRAAAAHGILAGPTQPTEAPIALSPSGQASKG